MVFLSGPLGRKELILLAVLGCSILSSGAPVHADDDIWTESHRRSRVGSHRRSSGRNRSIKQPGPALKWDAESTTQMLSTWINPSPEAVNTPTNWGSANHTVTDGWLVSPLDYKRPEGETVKIRFRVRLANTQPAPRGAMLFHFGGPGSDRKGGLELAGMYNLQIPMLFDEYDVIGIDQRGMGQSIPPGGTMEDVDWTASEPGIFYTTDKFCFPSNNSAAAMREASAKQYEALVESYYQPLYQMPSGKNYRDYAGTLNLAHDLELFRQSIGQGKLSLFGVSYGTQVVGVYATEFPEQADRVVMSSCLPPEQTVQRAVESAAEAAADAIAYTLQLCAGQKNCPLGDQPQAAYRHLTQVLDSGNASVGGQQIGSLVALAVGFGAGGPTTNIRALGNTRQAGVVMSGLGELYQASLQPQTAAPGRVTCAQGGGPVGAVLSLDYAGMYDEDTMARQSELLSAKYGAAGQAAGMLWALWMYGRGHARIPPGQPMSTLGNSKTPVLIVSPTYDAQTSYKNSQDMAARFPSGMLLSWKGPGHVVYPTNGLYSLPALQNCSNKIASYLRTGSVEQLRTDPICDNPMVPVVTQNNPLEYHGYTYKQFYTESGKP